MDKQIKWKFKDGINNKRKPVLLSNNKNKLLLN